MPAMKQIFLIVYIVILACGLSEAQDSIAKTQRRNTIKIDLTSHILYRNALGISYERLVKPSESFSVMAGYQEFPIVASFGQRITVRDDRKRHGYKFGGEYRFYLTKENRYAAPRGLYIGPYFALHRFNNTRLIEVEHNGARQQAVLDSKFGIFNVGIQVGYQFILNDRWTIDMVFAGPAISNYRYRLSLEGNYTFDKDDVQREILLDLLDRFPFLDDLISDQEAKANGRLQAWSFGYRYQLQIGYHFGRKK
jgi:hypothetical protein